MAYRVELTERAIRDLDHLYAEKNAAESEAAARRYNGLERAIYTLANYPRRCPAAPEASKTKPPLRHLLYGRKPHVYRIIYEIDEKRKTVWVLTIRHGAMEPAELDKIEA